MTKKTYFIENSNALDNTLDKIANKFPCWVSRDYIEMDFSKITIEARTEDIKAIEKMLSPLTPLM